MESSNLLGEVVTWDLDKALTTYSAVRDSLAAAGLEPDEAKELKPRAAFSRACKDLKQDRTIDKLKISDEGLEKFQFTRKETSATGTIDFDYECVVELDCENGDVACPENPEMARRAQELLGHAMQMRNAQDITRLVQRLFEKNADLYPINPRKGVAYFVPDAHRPFTARVEEFLKRLGGKLCRFPVPRGTPEGNASVKEAVQSGLSSLLAELDEKVKGWDETTRKSTMERALEEYQAVAYKVDAYAEYLESEQEGLRQKLAEAKQKLASKITESFPEQQAA